MRHVQDLCGPLFLVIGRCKEAVVEQGKLQHMALKSTCPCRKPVVNVFF